MNAPTPPRETLDLVGHDGARARFAAALDAGRPHHAWLLSGPAGVGKATLAFSFARILLRGTDPQSPQGRRITAATHPDLLLIARRNDEKKGRLKSEIVADDIRPVQSFLHHTAAEGGWRVVIVDGAEFLNRHAANALLKLLEEPPDKTVFFLTTASPGTLLPTIRSRCRALPLAPLTDVEMQRVLSGQGFARDVAPALVRQAQGAPGRILFLAQDRDESIGRIADAWLRGEGAETLLDDAERIARQEDGFALLCDLLGERLSDRAREFASARDTAGAASSAEAFSALAALLRETERFNLDKSQAVRQAATIVSVA